MPFNWTPELISFQENTGVFVISSFLSCLHRVNWRSSRLIFVLALLTDSGPSRYADQDVHEIFQNCLQTRFSGQGVYQFVGLNWHDKPCIIADLNDWTG